MRRFALVILLAACGPAPSPGGGVETGAPSPGPVTEVAFFQAVEVPVYQGGKAVGVSDRSAPLIVGRDAVVRTRIDPGSAPTETALELAVTVTANGVSARNTATGSIAADAAPDDPSGWLVVAIPASSMAEDATYSVTLSDDGTVVGRYPSEGELDLGAVATGPVEIVLVPFEVNGFVPDTSAAVVEGYRAALMAVFPVTQVVLSVAPTETWAGPLDLGDINVRVGEIQEAAMYAGEVDWNVYYYGMVSGVATRDEFEGATGTSEAGVDDPPVRAYFAAGAAFADQKSEDTFIHEMGHTHSLLHTPCDGEDNVDPNYPYEGGIIGVEGYDARTGSFVPADTPDLMSYCFPRWTSDYSYARVAAHVTQAQSFAGPQ